MRERVSFLKQLSDFDYRSLGIAQRVFLACDGTLCDAIEAVFREPIDVVKLSQSSSKNACGIETLNLGGTEVLMERKVIIRGAVSSINYVYAESYLAWDRLPRTFRRQLQNATRSIGSAWADEQMESRKELIQVLRVPSRGTPDVLWRGTAVIMRSYRVLSGKFPLMFISEYFPEQYNGPQELQSREGAVDKQGMARAAGP